MKSLPALVACGALLVAAACTSNGSGANTPDEFRVVTKAPLTVPPEYRLRPPEAGVAVPLEVDPERTEVANAFGTTIGKSASAAEKALVAAAGANAASQVIRNQIDYEEMKSIRKSKSAADRILFWRKDAETAAEPDNATGGAPVVIEKGNASPGIKLPGT